MGVEFFIGLAVFIFAVYVFYLFLLLANKMLVKFFNVVSSFTVVTSIYVVVYPPYQISIPKLVELNLGRFPLWEPPSAEVISKYFPPEFYKILPKVISDQNLSLFVNIDQSALFSNLASIFLIYVVVLIVYLTHKDG